jgi:tripeptidyl-peptidase-1
MTAPSSHHHLTFLLSVTGVGATTGFPETAANLSAGGFSNYFPRPDWQDDAVSGYLDFLGDTYSGLYNASGRAYPDVAAYGDNVQIFDKGVQSPVGGTSCSSPIFASVIALLNDQLMSAGQPPLGFLNPWLYSNASDSLNDMTEGFNPGCGTDGFPGTIGWDPVTGLGSPNFDNLLIAAGLTPPSD